MALSTNSSLNALPPIPIDPEDFIGLRFFLQALEDQVVKAINPNPSIPTGVTGLKVTAMNLGNLVAWNQSTNSEGYIVWRNISNNFTTATIIAQLAGIGNASAFDSVDQTVANQTRYYWVAPFNGNGIQGPLSAAVSSSNFAGDPSSTFLGINAKAAGIAAVAMGQNASAAGKNDTVAGQSSTTLSGGNNTVVGQGSSINGAGLGSTVIGQGSLTSGSLDTLVGQSAQIVGTGGENTCVGAGSNVKVSGGFNTVIGAVAYTSSASNSVAIGAGCNVRASNATAVGYTSSINGAQSTVLGYIATDAANNYCIVIGSQATATAANQCIIGSDTNAKITDFWFGRGVSTTNPTQTTKIHASDGSGSNITGDSLALYGGSSTGNANGGNLDFYTTPAGGAGSSLNTAVRAMRIDSTSIVTVTNTIASGGVATNASGSFYAGANSAADTYIADCASNTTTDACDIKFQRSGGTQASRTTAANGMDGGDYLWNFYDGSAFKSRAKISALVNGVVAGSTIPTDLVFYTGSGGLTEAFRLLSDQTAKFTGLITNYNSINTKSNGVPAIYGQGRSNAQTGDVASVAAYTVSASDGSFILSCNVLVTAFTAGTQSVRCDYTDESSTARTLTFTLSSVGGTLGLTVGAVGAFEGVAVHIRAKASTSITIKTVGTVWTGTYNVEGYITQL